MLLWPSCPQSRFFCLMLYPTFCSNHFISEKLGVEYDFPLTIFQFFRCIVALSYLVESFESVFYRSRSGTLQVLWPPGLRLELKWKQPRNKTLYWKKKKHHRWTFQRKFHLWYFYQRQKLFFFKKKKKIASSRKFPAEVHSIFWIFSFWKMP